MMLPNIVNLGPSTYPEGGLAVRDLDWKDGPPKDFGEIMKGKLEREAIPIPARETIQTQAPVQMPMQMQAHTQGGEVLKGIYKGENGSHSEKGAMLKFMDSFESELGIPSTRIVEAMAQLKPEELALAPSETAEKVIEKLDLDSKDAAIAERLYLTMLGQVQPATPLMASIPPTAPISSSLLTSMQEGPMGPSASVPAAQITVDQFKQDTTLKGLPVYSEQPIFGEVKAPSPSTTSTLQNLNQRRANQFESSQVSMTPSALKLGLEPLGRESLGQESLGVEPLGIQSQTMPSTTGIELQSLLPQNGEVAKFIGAPRIANKGANILAANSVADKIKDVNLSSLDSEAILAGQNPTNVLTPFDGIVSGLENAPISAPMSVPANPPLSSQNNSNVGQGFRPQDEAVLRSMMDVPKQFQQSGGFDSSGGFQQELKKFSAETKINDQNPFMVDQTLNANSSLKEARQADTVAQVSQDFMMSPAVQKSDNPTAANIQHILNQAQYMIQRGGGEMKIELHPKELGQLNLRIAVQDGRVDVQMLAETNEAKKIIETSINDLKARLSQHQLKVDLIQVDVGNTARNNLEQNLGQQSSHHQQSQQDLGRESARQFLGQFRDGNFANRQGFVDLSNFRGYQTKKTPSSMMEPIRPKTGPRREGQSLYLVA